jgi:hypothetical protein
MKTRILLIFTILFLGSSCRMPKKIATATTENVTVQEKQHQTGITESYTFVDTTKKTGYEISYLKVEFYKPDTISKDTAVTIISKNPEIKSIEKITVKATEETARVSLISDNNIVETNTDYNAEIYMTTETIEQPAADPYRWRYIFAICITILIAGIGAYFVLRKTTFVTTIISFVRKMF